MLWLGQAAFKITTPGGKVIVTDPWLRTNPLTPAAYKQLDAFGHIDVLLVSHGHFDHVADAPALAQQYNVPLRAPGDLNQTLTTLGVLPANLLPRMNKGGTVEPAPGIKVSAVRAEHSSIYVWRNPASNKDETHPGGEPVGWIIELENGFRIYHAGDTAAFGDMRLIGERYKPDLALVPIGGNFTMDPGRGRLGREGAAAPEGGDPDALRRQPADARHGQGIRRRDGLEPDPRDRRRAGTADPVLNRPAKPGDDSHDLHRSPPLLVVAGALAAGRAAVAQPAAFPSKPVKLLVGFAPGGAVDIIARAIGQQIAPGLGQPVVVENKPGAGTNIALRALIESPPDGYTLMLTANSIAANQTLYQPPPFDMARDFTPVALVGRVPVVLAANAQAPIDSIAKLVAAVEGVAAFGQLRHARATARRRTWRSSCSSAPPASS